MTQVFVCGTVPNSNPPVPVPCTYENVIPTNFQPNTFHRRIFPSRLNWLRENFMNQLDMNIGKNFAVTEGLRLAFRVDCINAPPRAQLCYS